MWKFVLVATSLMVRLSIFGASHQQKCGVFRLAITSLAPTRIQVITPLLLLHRVRFLGLLHTKQKTFANAQISILDTQFIQATTLPTTIRTTGVGLATALLAVRLAAHLTFRATDAPMNV
jgi:protein-S-isoprenylcysteine O-methyltransferase Ste14